MNAVASLLIAILVAGCASKTPPPTPAETHQIERRQAPSSGKVDRRLDEVEQAIESARRKMEK